MPYAEKKWRFVLFSSVSENSCYEIQLDRFSFLISYKNDLLQLQTSLILIMAINVNHVIYLYIFFPLSFFLTQAGVGATVHRKAVVIAIFV